jgi:predicted TIM-barrel fold metal-dependent hydrolase
MDARTRDMAIRLGGVDCDVHPPNPRRLDLLPFLDRYWQEAVQSRDIDRLELASYPSYFASSQRPDWQDGADPLERMQRHLLDAFGIDYAILNCVSGILAVYNDYMGAALCRAANDWIAATFLDRDPRLRASILLPLQNPELAVEEIERRAGDRRFVQVLVLAMGDIPLGRRIYWPVWAAAERLGLPIGIHAGSSNRHAPTQAGYPSFYVETQVGHMQGFGGQLLSFVAEGAFVKFPGLKLVMMESGVTWLPSLMWRMSKDWRGARDEVPWLKETPAAIIRRHVRMTLRPFSTDFPHWHFDGPNAMPPGFPARLKQKVLVDNPRATFPRREIGS